ncbi:hypothetical protein HN51_060047 [Arachis hypogaea]|uniref:Glycosyltransferase n=1 Tax=Arachis hypogaea TaxID=3818 RepID=A0A444X8P5_ARAHY|nr:UDP-glycosyltransferase 74G1 [Arachis ipaensis]XP_025682491.1 UDP-glycosyltransferase 74G1 [Arachis hypogaea]QHN83604.1 UDP-glycosyltransferase [Arachis hypogaea]RYQ85923.1 hypothetical protein Ahy_B10g105567 [Arachis hypogaea]
MENNNNSRKVHCLILSLPAQGHINPMIQFSKLLEHQGIKVTFVSTVYYCKNLHQVPPTISLETISDGFDHTGPSGAKNYGVYMDHFWRVGPENLANLVENLGRKGYPVDCIVYDAFFPWALETAKRFGIVGAAFLTQNMAVNTTYYHFHLGKIQVPFTEEEFSFPGLPKLDVADMPSFFFTYQEKPFLLDLLVDQFSNIHKADWILCNTFYDLGKEVNDWTRKLWPKYRTIGPNIPSMFLNKQYENDQDYGAAAFESEDCMEWLDNKPKGSVVYVSFGSLVMVGEDQIEEVAYALRESNAYFLWVVRASEQIKLPKDFENKSDKGLVVTWCPQLKVLAHEAIACFVTHCGWNSTLEALCLGVPIVAMPQWSDQNTNAKLIVDLWKMGIRAPMGENKIVRQEALRLCIREIIDSEQGKEIKNNMIQWKNLAIRAISEGGTSYESIKEFVNSLLCLNATCPKV